MLWNPQRDGSRSFRAFDDLIHGGKVYLAVASLITLAALLPASLLWAESSMAFAALLGAFGRAVGDRDAPRRAARRGRMRGRPG